MRRMPISDSCFAFDEKQASDVARANRSTCHDRGKRRRTAAQIHGDYVGQSHLLYSQHERDDSFYRSGSGSDKMARSLCHHHWQHGGWRQLGVTVKRRLLLLLANFGKEDKPEPVIPKISQETLAEMIGTTRSRVSFFMNKFRNLGH
jgi:Crp-like helix-turn-helix domain